MNGVGVFICYILCVVINWLNVILLDIIGVENEDYKSYML